MRGRDDSRRRFVHRPASSSVSGAYQTSVADATARGDSGRRSAPSSSGRVSSRSSTPRTSSMGRCCWRRQWSSPCARAGRSWQWALAPAGPAVRYNHHRSKHTREDERCSTSGGPDQDVRLRDARQAASERPGRRISAGWLRHGWRRHVGRRPRVRHACWERPSSPAEHRRSTSCSNATRMH